MNRKKDIEQLFRQHYAKMYNLARCILSDDDESKDVVSEVFAQILADDVVLVPGSEEGYLMKELNFKPQKTGLIVNRVPNGKLDAGTLEEIQNQGLELLGVVPHDDHWQPCSEKSCPRLHPCWLQVLQRLDDVGFPAQTS